VLGVPKLIKRQKEWKVACDKEIGMPKRREREREKQTNKQNGDGHWGRDKTQDFPQE